MRSLILTLVFLAMASVASGQVFEVKGGDSTLFNAAGGGIVLFLPNNTSEIDVGDLAGKLHVGASTTFDFHNYFITGGDHVFGFTSSGASLSVPERGLFVQHRGKRYQFSAFVGASGQMYSSPFFETTAAQHFGIGGTYKRDVGHGFVLSGAGVLQGGTHTLLGSAEWRSGDGKIQAAGSGGLLQNAKILNGIVSWQPLRGLSLSAAQNTYVLYGTPATTSNASANYSNSFFNVRAGVYHSAQSWTTGETAGVGAHVWILEGSVDYFRSIYGNQRTETIAEKITRHFTLREYITGRNLSFGAAYTSNLVKVDIGRSMYYLPTTGRFQSATTISLSFSLPHSTSVNLSTNVLPNGRVLWSTYGDSYIQGPAKIADTLTPMHDSAPRMGKNVVRGRIVDTEGNPVQGAVQVGQEFAIADSSGTFEARFKQAKAVSVKVVPEEFMTPGEWVVVECPATAEPAAGTGREIKIIVQRKIQNGNQQSVVGTGKRD
jgi:hypothetical protein